MRTLGRRLCVGMFLMFAGAFSGPGQVRAAVDASAVGFSGYMRAGVGTNLKGGAQECFSNTGAPGNEFRLGNECSIYGETAMTMDLLKAPSADQPYFLSGVRFAYSPPGRASFENTTIYLVEAYAEGGRFDGLPLRYWVGKRFYRDVDLHMDDFYFFGDMSGNGAGVMDIPVANGKVDAAFLFQVGSTRTGAGDHQAHVLDLRYRDVKLGAQDSVHFWTALGWAPGGTASNGTPYLKNDGWLAGMRWRRSLDHGFNDLAIIRGYRLMQGINLYGDSALENTSAENSDPARLRIVEHLTIAPKGTWAFHAALAGELRDSTDAAGTGNGTWLSVGARPVYFFSDHLQLAFEAGHSRVLDRSDGLGLRTLTRLTVAPQISMSRDIWARPVLRMFYTRSFWNEANTSKVAASAPSHAGTTSGQALGFQTEIWF